MVHQPEYRDLFFMCGGAKCCDIKSALAVCFGAWAIISAHCSPFDNGDRVAYNLGNGMCIGPGMISIFMVHVLFLCSMAGRPDNLSGCLISFGLQVPWYLFSLELAQSRPDGRLNAGDDG